MQMFACKAVLPREDQAFLDGLCAADKELNVGGVYAKLEEIACGMDACKKAVKSLRLLSRDLHVQYVEERTRQVPRVVSDTLSRLDVLIAHIIDEFTILQERYRHYNKLREALQAKETIDRINRCN